MGSVWNDSSVSYDFINIRIQKLTAQRPCIIIRFENLDMAFRLWPSLPSGSALTQLPLKTKNQKKVGMSKNIFPSRHQEKIQKKITQSLLEAVPRIR